jgi:hypothetical protein
VVDACFPFVARTADMRVVSMYCLASLVYHYEWLAAKLPSAHTFHQCLLARDERLLQMLRART